MIEFIGLIIAVVMIVIVGYGIGFFIGYFIHSIYDRVKIMLSKFI